MCWQSSQSPGWLQSPDTAVYTPQSPHNNKNMKILRGGAGGEEGRRRGGQFGKFHFSAMTMQFRSFWKINLIRKWSPTVGSFQIKCLPSLLSLQADDEIFYLSFFPPQETVWDQSLIWVICSLSNCRYLSFSKLHISDSFYWRFKDVLRTESC